MGEANPCGVTICNSQMIDIQSFGYFFQNRSHLGHNSVSVCETVKMRRKNGDYLSPFLNNDGDLPKCSFTYLPKKEVLGNPSWVEICLMLMFVCMR